MDDHSNAFNGHLYYQPGYVYGNGNRSASSNETDETYNLNCEPNLYSISSNNETHGSSYIPYDSGPVDVIHKPSNHEIHDGMHLGSPSTGQRAYVAQIFQGYNSDPRHYGHDDATNRTGTNAYLDGNTNGYGSYGYNGATAGVAPPSLSPSHPTHH